jgi:prepilin-type N-terminal cleavage/methylation domain-containing protein
MSRLAYGSSSKGLRQGCQRTRRNGLFRVGKPPLGEGARSTWGMTLIEVLIALAILATTAVVFLAAVFANYKAASLTQERTTAESLARSQLEAIKNAEYATDNNYDDYAIVHPPDYPIEIMVVPLAGDLQKVTVEISHGDKQVFAVEDYKVYR